MTSRPCPTREDLSDWLDDQLEESESTEISIHVDTCNECQGKLEKLTCRQAYGIRALGGRPLRGLRCSPTGTIAATDRHAALIAFPPGRQTTPVDAAAGRFRATSSREQHHDRGDLTAIVDETCLEVVTADFDRAVVPLDTEPAVPREAPKAWFAIPSYDVLEVIREGGMGVVYKARQRGLNRLVALKMIRGKEWSRPEHLARLRIEAEAVARLRHPNIVQIHEIGEVDGQPFLSLEFLEGGTLEDHLAGNPQSGKRAAELIATLARAIQTAHDVGIIHRDLKPSNVLFTGDGTPRITDFGLAKRLESDSRQTESGQIMGTPCYMAPEQAMGRTKDVGPSADVYALGAVLYEMLTGRPPFKGQTPVDTIRQVIEDDVVPPARLVPRVARDLETICLHCLSKEPSRRYRTAVALAEDLERYLAGDSIMARRTPLLERGVKLARRRPLAVALCTLSLAGTLGLSGAWMQSRARKAELRNTFVVPLLQAQHYLSQQQWSKSEPILTGIKGQIGKESGLDDVASRVEEMLAECEQGRAIEEARNEGETQKKKFERLWRDAVFHETNFTGLDVPLDKEAVRKTTRAALAVFARPGSENRWEPGALPAGLEAREQEELKEGCYELLLMLAEAVDQPEEGLRLLDRAAELRPPTRYYHLRRADLLALRGDAAGADRERAEASTFETSSAIDHFLSGKEEYKRKDWVAALSQFDEVLRIRPDHFWAHCLSAICALQLSQATRARAELNACLQRELGFAWLYELRGFAFYQVAALARLAAEGLPAKGTTLRGEAQVQLKAAEADYNKALELLEKRPNNELQYALLVNRGLLWLERREWSKAIADLQSAIRLNATQWQAHEMLAQVYDREGKPDLAIEQFTQAIARRPEMAALYRARANVEIRREKQTPAGQELALRDVETAIRLEPPGSQFLPGDQTNRARLLHRKRREDEALSACETALTLDPSFLEAHLLRINVLRKLKRHAEVIRSCDVLLARGKPSADLYELRALAKQELKDYDGAIEDDTLAHALRPRSAAILARRGRLFLVSGATRLALRDFEQAIDLDPSSPASADAYVGRGLARASLGLHREAVADAMRAVRMGEPTDEILYSAARIHAQAAGAAAAEIKKTGQAAAALASRHQDQALELLRQAIARLPAAERRSFLHDVVQTDPELASIRHRLRSLDLAGPTLPSERTSTQPQN
jgi:tetratricopeptide (TPR) repeat protein/tRNA A-37 threonylcarbamoyl transferase component Bud32